MILVSYPYLLKEDIIVDFLKSLQSQQHAAHEGAEVYWVLASSLSRFATLPTVFHAVLSLLPKAYGRDQAMVDRLFKMKNYLKEKNGKIPIHIYIHMLQMLLESNHHQELEGLYQEAIDSRLHHLSLEGLIMNSWRVRGLYSQCFDRYAQLLKRDGRIDDITFLGKMLGVCFTGKNWELGMQLVEDINGRYANSIPVAVSMVRFLKRLKGTLQSSDVSASDDELMIEKRKAWESTVPAKLDEMIVFLLNKIQIAGTLVTPKMFLEVIDEVVELGGLHRLVHYVIRNSAALVGFNATDSFLPVLHDWAAKGQWQNCLLFWEIQLNHPPLLFVKAKVRALGMIIFSLIKNNETERIRWLLKEDYVVQLLRPEASMTSFMHQYNKLAKRHSDVEEFDIHGLLTEAGFQTNATTSESFDSKK